jgi:hypothetical protein
MVIVRVATEEHHIVGVIERDGPMRIGGIEAAELVARAFDRRSGLMIG